MLYIGTCGGLRSDQHMARLGKKYNKGEVICRQGDVGDCMFVIQVGEVEALAEVEGKELKLRKMGPNEFFGEMALFEKEVRTATIRATKKTRVLTIDKKNFLGGIHEDPSLAFRIVETMSHRIRDLTDRLATHTGGDEQGRQTMARAGQRAAEELA